MRNERSHERKDQAGSCDPDPFDLCASNQTGTKETRERQRERERQRAPFLSHSCPRYSSPFPSLPPPASIYPHDPRQLSLATSLSPSLSPFCSPHVAEMWSTPVMQQLGLCYFTGVELCRIRSRPRIYICCDHVSAEQANPRYGIGGSWGVLGGSWGIVDSESRSITGANRGFPPRFIAPGLGLLIMPWHFSPVSGISATGHGSGEHPSIRSFLFSFFFRGFISLCAFAIRTCSLALSHFDCI